MNELRSFASTVGVLLVLGFAMVQLKARFIYLYERRLRAIGKFGRLPRRSRRPLRQYSRIISVSDRIVRHARIITAIFCSTSFLVLIVYVTLRFSSADRHDIELDLWLFFATNLTAATAGIMLLIVPARCRRTRNYFTMTIFSILWLLPVFLVGMLDPYV